MSPGFMVIAVVLIVVFSGLANSYVKDNKKSNHLFRKDMKNLNERMAALEEEMKEQKELVADTIIEQS